MDCIYCSSATKVTNSRPSKRTHGIWRRRRCVAENCTAIFTSYESVDYAKSIVVQYGSGKLTAFDRDRLFISIYESMRHRPDALQDATAITQTCMTQLIPMAHGGLLDRDVIVTVCTAILNRFDHAGATMYGAFHKLI